MSPKFKFYEIVRIIAVPTSVRKDLVNKEGIVVGMSDTHNELIRDYGIHVNEYGETFALPEHSLESTGKHASQNDIVSRSRWSRGPLK